MFPSKKAVIKDVYFGDMDVMADKHSNRYILSTTENLVNSKKRISISTQLLGNLLTSKRRPIKQ